MSEENVLSDEELARRRVMFTEEDAIIVNATALRALLAALNGPAHHIREIQATTNPLVDPSNPIVVLTNEFNAIAGG